MKRFYGFNNKTPDAEWHDGVEFATDSIPEDEWDKIADSKGSGDTGLNAKKKLKLTAWCACATVFFVDVMMFIEKLLGESMDADFAKIVYHPFSIPIHVVCTAFFAIGIFKYFSNKENMVSLVVSHNDNSFDDPFYKRLGVPDDAKSVDILCFEYDPDREFPTDMDNCLNTEMKIYKENDSLCFADTEKKYEIPLSQLRRIKAVNKVIGMILWNKKESFRKSPYSEYNIVIKKGNYVVPKYYELEFEHEGELWFISFPCYELSTFQLLTGLTAEY